MSVPIPKAKFLLLEVSKDTLSQNIWHMKSVHIIEAKFLLLEVITTTLNPSMMSVHITEAKVLLLEVSSNTLRPSIWHNDVSTLDWGQVSTARGQLYYTESRYLTQLGQYKSLRPSLYC